MKSYLLFVVTFIISLSIVSQTASADTVKEPVYLFGQSTNKIAVPLSSKYDPKKLTSSNIKVSYNKKSIRSSFLLSVDRKTLYIVPSSPLGLNSVVDVDIVPIKTKFIAHIAYVTYTDNQYEKLLKDLLNKKITFVEALKKINKTEFLDNFSNDVFKNFNKVYGINVFKAKSEQEKQVQQSMLVLNWTAKTLEIYNKTPNKNMKALLQDIAKDQKLGTLKDPLTKDLIAKGVGMQLGNSIFGEIETKETKKMSDGLGKLFVSYATGDPTTAAEAMNEWIDGYTKAINKAIGTKNTSSLKPYKPTSIPKDDGLTIIKKNKNEIKKKAFSPKTILKRSWIISDIITLNIDSINEMGLFDPTKDFEIDGHAVKAYGRYVNFPVEGSIKGENVTLYIYFTDPSYFRDIYQENYPLTYENNPRIINTIINKKPYLKVTFNYKIYDESSYHIKLNCFVWREKTGEVLNESYIREYYMKKQ
ncbi:hypothetical protein [Peribacillus simplex]|uniref:hypothetical protein n=1 Tax=Peribacillus simplex TaxID=1478 RepID=UPI00333C782B